MYAHFSALASGAIIVSMLPAVQAHMAIWGDFVYGNNKGSGPVQPLANKGFNEWWFRGYQNERPSQVLPLNPGQDVHMDIACSKRWTQYGDSPSADACPNDSGSFHAGGTSFVEAGWSGNSDSNLMGCALAIAFKSDINSVQPEDFTVMSVQADCVRQRDTTFAIPSNLPACPNGECVCAWFWQGKNSADEMYMNGFRCNVQGGVATTSYPKPVAPRRNAINGPTQPMYWANDRSNLDYSPNWSTKPSYNSAWGWKDGAQTDAFSGLGGGGNVPVNSTANSRPSSTGNQWEESASSTGNQWEESASSTGNQWEESASSTGNQWDQPRPTSTGNQWENPQPTQSGNDWEGDWQATTTSRRWGKGRHRSSSAAAGSPTWYVHAADPTPSVEAGNVAGDPAGGPVGGSVGGPAGGSEGSGNSTRPAGCKRNLRSRRRAAKH